jgi:hypothetical protein
LDAKCEWRYFHCGICDLRFKDPAHHLSPALEKARYDLHQNEAGDVRYQAYMRPIAAWIEQHCPEGQGLDFGCGKTPMLKNLLSRHQMDWFDPYFHPDAGYKQKKYDFVAAIETVEHFYRPALDWEHMRTLLAPNGGLAAVTALFRESMDFASWYYRLDPTHVCFYSSRTFEWLRDHFGFRHYTTDGLRFNWLQL